MKKYMFGVVDNNDNVIENWVVASKTYKQAIERANDVITNYGHTKRTRVYLQETYLNNYSR